MTLRMPVRRNIGVAREAEEVATAVPSEASHVRAEPWFRRFARLGLSTRAVIYVLLAYIAADLSLTHASAAEASGSGALSEVGRQPAGRVMLGLLTVGLAGYAFWRVAHALSRDEQADQQGERQPARRTINTFERAGWLCTAVVYFVLCGQAAVLALSASSAGSGGGPSSRPQPFVASVLRWPAGPLWVGLAGAGIAIGGAALVVWGAVHDYSEVLETDRMSRRAYRVAQLSGIVGEAARGLLILLVSVYLLAAAVTDNPARAKSPNGALLSFDRLPAGQPLLLVIVIGLLGFAVYSLFEALYRKV